MSINYTTLFTRLGKVIKYTNAYLTFAGTTLLGADSGADDILDEFNDRRDLVEGVQTFYTGCADTVSSWCATLQGIADNVLIDLQSELNAEDASVESVLPLLILDMIAESESVDANGISTPVVAANGANTGDGSLVVDETNIDGDDDERAISEVVEVICMSDQYTGTGAGSELFYINGYPNYGAYSYKTRGSGTGTQVTCSCVDSTNTFVTDGGFETWASNVPSNWDVDSGTGTTHIVEENSTIFSGDAALELVADGGTTNITLSQTLTGIQKNTKYVAGVRLRKGTVAAGSNFKVRIKGTGITDIDLFDADPNTLTTSYVLHHIFFALTDTVPSDLEIEITWPTAGSTNTNNLFVDEVVIVPAVFFGYNYYALFRGDTDFLVEDRFSVTTANDYAGTIQTYFGRVYGTMLPSNGAGSETIDDALAE